MPTTAPVQSSWLFGQGDQTVSIGVPVEPNLSRVILYRQHPNGGAVFAFEQTARRTDAIYRALDAETWGEFRRLLPQGEWDGIQSRLKAEAEDDFGDDDPAWTRDDAPFQGYSDVPGASDGDYPQWLQQCMEEVIPHDLLCFFGRRETSVIGGSFWYLPWDSVESLATLMRNRGFSVFEGEGLTFF